jgi:hypothetical protein
MMMNFVFALLWAFLEVLLRVVEKLEEVRGFSCSEASDGRVILVRVIFASKLSVMDLDFSLGCSKSKSKNRE